MMVTQDTATDATGIDPERLAVCLEVLAAGRARCRRPPRRRSGCGWPPRALFKTVKQRRRRDRRAEVAAADRAVIAATATGAPGRIDDETQGLPLRLGSAAGAPAGVLRRARPCYICKQRYAQVDAFYHQLCPACAALNRARRDARTDLTGRRALLTGGRAKIGMYIALRLLRDGAHTTITTRFPHDAVRRFAAMPDSADWLHRLRIVGIDLRDPAQVVALADSVAAAGPARHPDQQRGPDRTAHARRVRPPGRRRVGAAAGRAAARAGHLRTSCRAPGRRHRGRSTGSADDQPWTALAPHALDRAGADRRLGLAGADRGRHRDRRRRPRPRPGRRSTAGSSGCDEVDPIELLEVQLCNVTAPFILVSRLRPAMAAATGAAQVRGERLRDGGPVRPRLQGTRPPAHQHGQGRAEHADPHQRAGDARPTAS